jgi:hypothetical protein
MRISMEHLFISHELSGTVTWGQQNKKKTDKNAEAQCKKHLPSETMMSDGHHCGQFAPWLILNASASRGGLGACFGATVERRF